MENTKFNEAVLSVVLSEWERLAAEYGILKDFEKQKQYKTLRGFVLAYERRLNHEQNKT